MTELSQAPMTSPGEISQWPMLKIVYRTDPDAIARLLPPGIEPGDEPKVNIFIYNIPVLEEPEYGVIVTVDAKYEGQKGEYALAYGIDQEGAIMISCMMNGQPKYLCHIDYYRKGKDVVARCHHQGYTFIEFSGEAGEVESIEAVPDRVEWWTKYSRKVGGSQGYDFPPHVVKAHGQYGSGYRANVEGQLKLLESPWDPIAKLLPLREQLSACLLWRESRGWAVSMQGPLDPDGFWPFVDTIGGSRWPGFMGAPPKN